LEQRCRFTADFGWVYWTADWGVALLLIAGEPVVNMELANALGRQPATERKFTAQRARPSRV
jgi:hypothetical protein